MSQEDPESAPPSCPQCNAIVPSAVKFCTACGAALAAAPATGVAPGRAPSRRRGERMDDAVARSAARQEFGRIKSIVPIVRSIFWAGAVVGALRLVAVLLLGGLEL